MMEYTIFGESHGPAVGVFIQNIQPVCRWTAS